MNTLPHLAMDRGLAVFPCKPGEKVPATPHGFLDATTDREQIIRWSRSVPGCNWAARMGDGVFCLDVDARSGGYDALATLIGINGPLPSTLQAETGGGGEHHLYRLAGCLEKWPARIAPGLDIKGDGGYIVCEPSIHPSGNPYMWVNEAPIAPAPAWLEARIRTATRRIIAPKIRKPSTQTMSPAAPISASELAAMLGTVEAKGDQYFVRCICHNETHPSLAIREGRDGRLLWHCYGGCDKDILTEAIVGRIRECRT